jgi:threonine dehydratase
MATDDVLEFDPDEGARVVLAALCADLNAVVGDLFALFMKNRDHVSGGAATDASEEQFERAGSGFPSAFDVYRLGMPTRRGGDEEFVSGVLDGCDGLTGGFAHASTNSTPRYTEGFMADSLTLSEIQNARQRIAACIRRTPLTANSALSERLKTNVYVKLELFQKTGSFKVRGAFNKILALKAEERGKGVVAVSGGNHAQAVAHAARTLGLKAAVLMPESTPKNYVEATRGYGAEVKFAADVRQAFAEVAEYERQGWAYIHPFDDVEVMAGQGTIGLEILEDAPQVTDIVLSIGGGGLMAGVATAVKTLKPSVRIWGVETEGADCMSKSLAAGKVVTLDAITSVARTLGAPAPSERTFAAAKSLLESVTVVSDREALDAVRYILERLKVLTEPAASCTLAAAERLKDQFAPDRHVVLIFCGGNMPISDLALIQ